MVVNCPHCNRPSVKRGRRKTKTGPVQLYYCHTCRRRFSLAPLPFRTYRPEVVLAAPVYYYTGLTLHDIQKRLRARFKVKPSVAAINNWVREFGKYSPLKTAREQIQAFGPPHKIIVRKLLPGRPQQPLRAHGYKLALLSGANGAALRKYLQNLLDGTSTIRAKDFTQHPSTILPALDVTAPARASYICNIAAIAVKASANNYQRHCTVERFLLATDRATVAVEVPVFLTDAETRGILHCSGGLLGYADFLQVFNDTIYVVDYKPDRAPDQSVAAQLFLYALALSRRTGIQLKHIRCAWFNAEHLWSFPAMEGSARLRRQRGILSTA